MGTSNPEVFEYYKKLEDPHVIDTSTVRALTTGCAMMYVFEYRVDKVHILPKVDTFLFHFGLSRPVFWGP